jgi:hypothetical protein
VPTPMVPWMREGSIYPPELLQVLSRSHRRSLEYSGQNQHDTVSESPPCSPTSAFSPDNRASQYREALVFEREVTLTSAGGRKRCSVQVKVDDLDPETLDMMLELRDLNNFFSEQSPSAVQDLEAVGAECKPAIMVSTSTVAMPISLSSTGTLALPEHDLVPLAVRRGCRVPTRLQVKKDKEIAYPGVPTPFLGTPSSYRIDFTPKDVSGMEVEDMVKDLRARCNQFLKPNSVQPHTVPRMKIEKFESSYSGELASISEVSEESEEQDDWAFADDLMQQWGDDPMFGTQLSPIPLSQEVTSRSSSPGSPALSVPIRPQSSASSLRSILKSPKLTKVVRFQCPSSSDSDSSDESEPMRKKKHPSADAPNHHHATMSVTTLKSLSPLHQSTSAFDNTSSSSASNSWDDLALQGAIPVRRKAPMNISPTMFGAKHPEIQSLSTPPRKSRLEVESPKPPTRLPSPVPPHTAARAAARKSIAFQPTTSIHSPPQRLTRTPTPSAVQSNGASTTERRKTMATDGSKRTPKTSAHPAKRSTMLLTSYGRVDSAIVSGNQGVERKMNTIRRVPPPSATRFSINGSTTRPAVGKENQEVALDTEYRMDTPANHVKVASALLPVSVIDPLPEKRTSGKGLSLRSVLSAIPIAKQLSRNRIRAVNV